MRPETEEDDERIRRIVEACLEAADAGLAPDIARWCEHDPAIEARVRALLGFEPLAASLLRVEGGDAPPDGLPAQLGSYVLKGRIGAGGMGQVFLAFDPSLGREVALKILRAGSTEPARFRREAAIAAALDHPNIVSIHEIGEDQGFSFIAMKRLSGPSLDAMAVPLDPRAAAEIGIAIARALHFAHGAGVVHRDVKPANIVLDRGIPHLVDFGLARSTSFATMTAEGRILGTLPYMAPERFQRSDAETGTGADIYGLGASLYECVSGRPCFSAKDRGALLKLILLTDAPPLRLVAENRGFEAIIFRALQKERRHRFASAGEMADELEHWLAGRPIKSRRENLVVRQWRRARRNPRATSLATLLVLVALGLAGALFFQRVERALTLESGIHRIETLLEDGQLLMAEEVLETLRRAAPGASALESVAARIDAALAVEDLLDHICGDAPAIPAGPDILSRLPRSELMTRVDASRGSGTLSLFAGLALAHAATTVEDRSMALRVLAELEGSQGPTRATRAIRAVATSHAEWEDPGLDAQSAIDQLFTSMVMRNRAAPLAEREKELKASFTSDRTEVQYRLGLCRAQLRADQGRYEDALDICTALRRTGRHNDAIDRMRAHLLILLGDDDGALAAIGIIKLERRRPFDDYLMLALLRKKGDAAALAAAWTPVHERWKDSPEILLAKGYFAMAEGRHEEALASFLAASRIEGWYHLRETAAAEALWCRLAAAEDRGVAGGAEVELVSTDAEGTEFRLPYARSIALLVQGRAAELAGDHRSALERTREAGSIAPENALAPLRLAHLAYDRVAAAEPWNGKALTPGLEALSTEGRIAADRFLRIDGRRVALARGARARAAFYSAALALAQGDRGAAQSAAKQGLAEPAGEGSHAAAITEGLRWVAERAKSERPDR